MPIDPIWQLNMSVHLARICYPHGNKICPVRQSKTIHILLLATHGICHWKDQK